ncbi:MAG: hypothetical protein FJ125_10355 [Deltaproteobacteria bacterium]|nr:hypothetical protein [Deltaproteobacteria bacterium]
MTDLPTRRPSARLRLRVAAPPSLLVSLMVLVACAGACAGLAGCLFEDSRQSLLSEPPELDGPYALNRFLYYIDHSRSQLLVVDPLAQEGPVVRTVALERGSPAPLVLPRLPGSPFRLLAMLQPARYELLLLREGAGDAALSSAVMVQRLPLSLVYQRLSVSPDGRYLLATLTEVDAQQDIVKTVGKVAVIDLQRVLTGADDGAELVQESILDLEEVPGEVILSGPLTLQDEEMPVPVDSCDLPVTSTVPVMQHDRHLALLVTQGRMAILDLENPGLRARTLTFSAAMAPRQLLFAPDPDGHPRILYTNRQTRAITSLTVSLNREKHACLASEQDADTPELIVDAMDLGAEVQPSELAVLAGADRVPTVVAAGSGERKVAVLQLRGSLMGDTVELAMGVDRVAGLQGSDGRDVALLYGERVANAQVALLRLVNSEDQPQIEVTYPKPFRYPVHSVEAIPGQRNRVLIHLRGSVEGEVLELLDVDTGRAIAIQFRSRPRAALFSDNGGELFLVAGSGWDDSGFLVRLDLGTASALGQQQMRLDHMPQSVMLLEEVGLLVVGHAHPTGRLTVVPAAELRRQSAWILEGIFLDRLIGQGR